MKKLILPRILLLIVAINSNAQEIFDEVKANDLNKVKVLVEKDTSLVILKDQAGNTPLHHAAISGTKSMAEYLLKNGSDINAVNSQLNTPLLEAIRNKKEEMVSPDGKYLFNRSNWISAKFIEKLRSKE